MQLEVAFQALLNGSSAADFEELLFWGKVEGLHGNYFVAEGIKYSQHYEFPEKVFYWCSSNTGYSFKRFQDLNDQHKEFINTLNGLFWCEPAKILKEVEEPKPEGDDPEAEPAQQQEPVEKDPLASSDSEDEIVKVQPKNLTEIDRLHYVVRAIENDCQIVP